MQFKVINFSPDPFIHTQIYHTQLGTAEQNVAASDFLSAAAPSAAFQLDSDAEISSGGDESRWSYGGNLCACPSSIVPPVAEGVAMSSTNVAEAATPVYLNGRLLACRVLIRLRRAVRSGGGGGGLVWHPKGCANNYIVTL